MGKRRYYVSQKAGVRQYFVESGEDTAVFTQVASLAGLNIERTRVPIPKAVSRSYPAANATMNYELYPEMVWPDQFIYTDAYRRRDVGLSIQLKTRQRVFQKSLTDPELYDVALRSKIHYDLSANILGVYQTGPSFVDASLQTILNQVAANYNPIWAGAGAIVYNFETIYMTAIAAYDYAADLFDARGVLQHFTDAATRVWVCELSSIFGQSKTIQALWNDGQLNAEIAQRQVNRHVMLLKWTKLMVGATTLVVNGDGNLVYQNGSVAFSDDYAAVYAASGTGGAYVPAMWTTGANFASIAPSSYLGTAVSGGGDRFWDVQSFLNNYSYVGEGYLQPADYDLATSTNIGYLSFWDKVEPGAAQDDVNVPTMTILNRRKMVNFGRPSTPIIWQGHNRFEFGVKRLGSQIIQHLWNLGPDGDLMPPYQCEVLAIVTRMSATKVGDGLTIWTTITQGGPGVSDEHNTWSDRPLWERMAYYTGLYRLYRFVEYFTPANNPLFFAIDDVYVRYPNLTGGDWGVNMRTAGGDGFWKRGAGLIVNHQNPSPNGTKVGVMLRIVSKNGALWMLYTATNWRQGRNDISTFDIRLKAADIGLAADIDVLGLTVNGWSAAVGEVCLQPNLLTTPIGS